MNFFKTLKTKLIIEISLLVIISTLFVLVFVNFATQQRGPKAQYEVTIDANKPLYLQREQIQQQIQENIQAERSENTARLLVASFIGIFGQIIFTSIGTYLLIKHELKPLENLNKTIKEINEKVLYIQIKKDNETSEELNELIESFNQMMERINKAFKSQRHFVENVSHEIKTPLTIVQTNLESIIYDSKISKSDREIAIKNSIDSIKFLNKLVEDLLLLSFIDKGSVKFENINLKDLSKEILSELKPSVEKKNLNLKLESLESEKYLVHANLILIKRAISNLVENAIKYSNDNSEILIRLEKESEKVNLSVENEGEPIADEFKERIFERFFRIDKSRSRATGGFGLGLAITKEIIESFGGKITLNSKENRTQFIIRF